MHLEERLQDAVLADAALHGQHHHRIRRPSLDRKRLQVHKSATPSRNVCAGGRLTACSAKPGRAVLMPSRGMERMACANKQGNEM